MIKKIKETIEHYKGLSRNIRIGVICTDLAWFVYLYFLSNYFLQLYIRTGSYRIGDSVFGMWLGIFMAVTLANHISYSVFRALINQEKAIKQMQEECAKLSEKNKELDREISALGYTQRSQEEMLKKLRERPVAKVNDALTAAMIDVTGNRNVKDASYGSS